MKTLLSVFAVFLTLFSALRSLYSEPHWYKGTYLGVEGYGTVERDTVLDPQNCIYRFNVNGTEKLFSIDAGSIWADDKDSDSNGDGVTDYWNVLSYEEGAYTLQNMLRENYTYRILAKGSNIYDLECTETIEEYTPVLEGTAGLRTMKNFLTTAIEPMGAVLYVYGGGWDFQDIASAPQSMSIGVSGDWVKFYKSHDAAYVLEDEKHPEKSYFPTGGWNEYYYAGLDCSGYVGWILYNTFYDESGVNKGMVRSAAKIAKWMADNGYGTWTNCPDDKSYENVAKTLKTGDIVSVRGHVYICIGKCEDKSAVIIHCAPAKSVTGDRGGGVRIGALNPSGDSKDCEAYNLACEYTAKYFPEWNSRYQPALDRAEKYLTIPDDIKTAGIFHWNIDETGLTDPDGYSSMTAAQILADLFEDK